MGYFLAPRWGSRAPCGRPFVPRFQDSDFDLGIWDLGFGISAGLPAVIPALKCLLSPDPCLLPPISSLLSVPDTSPAIH